MHIMDNLQINVFCIYFHLIQYNWIHTDFYLTQLVTKQSCRLKVIFFLVSGIQKIFEHNYDLNVKKIKSKQTQVIFMLKNIKIFFSTALSNDTEPFAMISLYFNLRLSYYCKLSIFIQKKKTLLFKYVKTNQYFQCTINISSNFMASNLW